MVIIMIGALNSVLLTFLIVLTYFKGYEYIINKSVLFTMTDVYSALAFSVMIVSFIVFIFSTRFNDLFFNFVRRHRKPIKREQDRLYPLIEEIQKNIEGKLHRKIINVSLKIKDEDCYYSSAVGIRTIAINRKIYEDYDDTVLKAVLAHEMAHLYNREGCKAGILLILSVMFTITLGSVWIISAVAWNHGKESRGGVTARAIGVSAYLIALLAAGFVLCGLLGYFIFHLSLKLSYRSMCYRSDQFVISLGYKEGLMEYLESNKNDDYLLNSWIMHFLNLAPKKLLRIGNIEKLETRHA